MSGIRLGVVTPIADEADTIDELIKKDLENLGPSDHVFFITDNKTDIQTREKIKAWRETDHRVEECFFPQDRCVVDAYFNGYQKAYDEGCEWILEMDGGLSHDPSLIPRFIKAMEHGYDFAAGSRFMKGSEYPGGSYRKLISWGGTLLSNIYLGTRMRDMTSGFECFSRTAMKKVLEKGVKSRAHFFQTEIKYMLRDVKWIEVPISYNSPSKRLQTSSIFEAFRILHNMKKDNEKAKK
jgi:dolichol-phosphate mannosyltransferase